MWLYRNSEPISLFEGDNKFQFVERLSALEYTVFTYVYHDSWISEDEVIKKLRQSCGYIFNFISDNAIKEIMYTLYMNGYFVRELIITDRTPTDEEKDNNTVENIGNASVKKSD